MHIGFSNVCSCRSPVEPFLMSQNTHANDTTWQQETSVVLLNQLMRPRYAIDLIEGLPCL